MLPGQGKNLVAELGDQRLIGGDHVLAMANSFLDQFASDSRPADQFNNNIDLGISDHVKNIAADAGLAEFAVRVVPSGAHVNDDEVSLGPGTDQVAVALQDVERSATDRTEAANSNVNRFHQYSVVDSIDGANQAWPSCFIIRLILRMA